MARPTVIRDRGGVPSYAPEVRQGPGLGVYAPLDVRAAPSGATQLVEALGIVNDTVQPVFQRKAEKEAFESASQGETDMRAGKVDIKRRLEDAAYDKGVKRIATENAVIDTFGQFETWYENEGQDLSEDELRQEFNTQMQTRLEPLLSDGEASRWAYERIAPLSEKIFAEHRAKLANEFREQAVATAGGMIRMNLAANKPTDPEEIMTMLRPVLGNSEATKQFVDMVGAIAVENRNPKLLDVLIPEKWADGTPGARAIPKYANAINQYRYYAEAAMDSDNREAKKAAADKTDTSMLQVMQLAGDGNMVGALKALDQMVDAGLPMSPSDYRAARSYIEGRKDFFNDQQYSPTALAEFRLKLADDPMNVDVIKAVGTLFPADRNGTQMTAQLMDDVISARKSVQAQQANPTAKAYRSALVARFKPDAGSTQAKKDRYSAGLLAFDLEFAKNKDPDKANEAAKKVFDATDTKGAPATGDIAVDVKALGAGELDAEAFARKHSSADSVAAIREAARKGLITPEAALEAAKALQR
jgi:hypothetical protein